VAHPERPERFQFNSLKMYLKYFKIRFLSVYRTICELNFLQLLLLLSFVLFAAAVYTVEVLPYYSPAVMGLIFYFYHIYRHDKRFIRLFFGKRHILIHWLEYGNIITSAVCDFLL
jgi:hypothetical protein